MPYVLPMDLITEPVIETDGGSGVGVVLVLVAVVVALTVLLIVRLTKKRRSRR